jgi:hypothetical protein
MTFDRFYRLTRIIYEIRERIRSMHLSENHWLRLRSYTDGSFFKEDLGKQTLNFSLEVGINVEVEVHPSGRSIRGCEEVDCLTQVVSVKIWHSQSQDPCTYKWEYGSPTKLKKDDENWCEGICLLKGIELILEDALKNMG